MAKYRRTFLLLCLLISLLIHYGGFHAYKSLFQDEYIEVEFIEKCEDVLSNDIYKLDNNSYLMVKKVKTGSQLNKLGIESGDYIESSIKKLNSENSFVKINKSGVSFVVNVSSKNICYE